MKRFSLLATLLLCFTVSFAQDLAKKMKDNEVVKGTVFVDGKSIEGYIKAVKSFVIDNEMNALYIWKLQYKIEFIEKSVFENTEKIKGKLFTKYTSKNCSGFIYEDEKLGAITFEATKYHDASALGFPANDFLQVLKKYGDITFYAWYEAPATTTLMLGASDGPALTPEDAYLVPQVFVKREGSSMAHYAGNFKVEKEFADQKELLEKYNNEEFDSERTIEMNDALFGLPVINKGGNASTGRINLNFLEAYINSKK